MSEEEIVKQVYNVDYEIGSDLRALRRSLQLLRDRLATSDSNLRFWSNCPGKVAPELRVEQFAVAFLLRKFGKRYIQAGRREAAASADKKRKLRLVRLEKPLVCIEKKGVKRKLDVDSGKDKRVCSREESSKLP
jgi:hypothetical protein